MSSSPHSYYLHLGKTTRIRIRREDMGYFRSFDFSRLIGSTVQVQGMLLAQDQYLMIPIRHPADLMLVP